MGKKQQGAKQHYVPQFYLKEFTFEGKDGRSRKFWSLDLKHLYSPGLKGPGGVCYEKNFYDFESGSADENQQLFDFWLSKHQDGEPLLTARLQELIEAKGHMGITKEMRRDWARMMAIQRMRTVAAREFLFDVERAAVAENMGARLDTEGFDEAKFHWMHFSHPRWRLIEEVWVRRFWWVVFVNETNVPFITSDNPVSFNKVVFHPDSPYDRKETPTKGAIPSFAVHYFPVSKKICVAFAHDAAAFFSWGVCDGRYSILEGESGRSTVDFINERQIFSARRYVLGPERFHLERVAELAKMNRDRHAGLWGGACDPRRSITINGESLTPEELEARLTHAPRLKPTWQ